MNFMNKNWKDYLKSGDKVVFHAQSDDNACMLSSILPALFTSVAVSFAAFYAGAAAGNSLEWNFLLVSMLGFVLWVFIFLPLFYFQKKSFHFVLTGSGAYSVGGLIFKKIRYVPYNRITDAAITRGIIGQICGTGSVGVSTAGGTKMTNGTSQPFEIVIAEVSEFQKIRQEILKKMK